MALAALVAALLVGCSGDDPRPTTAVSLADESATLEAADQGGGDQIVVRRATVPEPGGYLVVYEDVNGAPGRRLAATSLLDPGAHEDVEVPVEDGLLEGLASVFVMLHREASGDGTLDHPGPDEPVAEDGRVLTIAITLS